MIFKQTDERAAFETDALALAFVGDAVHALVVKNGLLLATKAGINVLHRTATLQLKGANQAKQFEKIKSILTEKEQDIARRARNHKVNTAPKNLSLAEYKSATALEAVIGYNWLIGNEDRIEELLK